MTNLRQNYKEMQIKFFNIKESPITLEAKTLFLLIENISKKSSFPYICYMKSSFISRFLFQMGEQIL